MVKAILASHHAGWQYFYSLKSCALNLGSGRKVARLCTVNRNIVHEDLSFRVVLILLQ
jgi:hypothetical protein